MGIDEAGLGLTAGGNGVVVGVAACGRCGGRSVDDCLCIRYDGDEQKGEQDGYELHVESFRDEGVGE